ncbi:hypothetical protein C0J52_04525 [Blattella germanica]|nr:hypothetical protein C0J52_04525 [Blattella germanica]
MRAVLQIFVLILSALLVIQNCSVNGDYNVELKGAHCTEIGGNKEECTISCRKRGYADGVCGDLNICTCHVYT